MKDYSTARFWAISSIGYGKGFTAEEALENYVATQLHNYRASATVFKTKAKWAEALRTGEAKPDLFRSPEGWTGFSISSNGTFWTRDDAAGKQQTRPFAEEDEVELP